jgi:hypothetical protein
MRWNGTRRDRLRWTKDIERIENEQYTSEENHRTTDRKERRTYANRREIDVIQKELVYLLLGV